MEEKNQHAMERIKRGMESTTAPHLYLNSFTICLGLGDIVLVLEKNNQVEATLNISFTLAKSLVEKLNGTIQQLELKTGNKIMSVDTIEKALHKKP